MLIHQRKLIGNTLGVFVTTLGITHAVLHKWPYKIQIGNRRLHHLETGCYLVAAGLALILDDKKDWNINDKSFFFRQKQQNEHVWWFLDR